MAAFREKVLKSTGETLDAEGWKALFLAMGWDKPLGPPPAAAPPAAEAKEGEEAKAGDEGAPPAAEGGDAAAPAAEGGDAAAAAPAAEGDAAAPAAAAEPAAPPAPAGPVASTNNHAAPWAALTAFFGSDAPAPAQLLVGTVHVCKAGFSEASFKAVVKAGDLAGAGGGASEAAVFTAVRACANRREGVNAVTLAHLRRAWRKADKAGAAAAGGEGGEGSGEGEGKEGDAPAAPAAPADPAAVQVVPDSFFEAVAADELLAELLCKDVPVPIKEPVAPEEPAAE